MKFLSSTALILGALQLARAADFFVIVSDTGYQPGWLDVATGDKVKFNL